MTNYVNRLGLTAWRKKSAVLITFGLLTIIIFGLQYNKINENDGNAKVIVDNQQQQNIKFIDNNVKPSTEPNRKPIENDVKQTYKPPNLEILETDQQLGIPYVNLDPINPYRPKKRIVHFDLKGAPPLTKFFKRIFPLIRNMGATGILLEYEDMFPYGGNLRSIAAKNAYTQEQLKEILEYADKSHLDVIPLVQTFGHVEFVLKHHEFSHLREVPGSPQALCPNRNASINFIKEMVKQVMVFHPKSKYLHIGCDEVFQMGECEVCRLEYHETIFLKHIKNIAKEIHKLYPKLNLIIWDDMLRHLSLQSLIDAGLSDFITPMVWVYAEDIYRFVQPPVWDKYSTIFRTIWTASAYKGAFGETLTIPDARRHLENNLKWLDVMAQQDKNFRNGIQGIAITGWQRYDHFAVLCELLPASLPSLSLCLTAITHGYFNASLKYQFLSTLNCPTTLSNNVPFINLETDRFLWDKLGRCMFPGQSFFRLIYRLNYMENEIDEFVKQTKRYKGWMTDYNVRYNYSLPLRVDELVGDLPRIYHGTVSLIHNAVDAMIDIFDNYTIGEWIEQKIYPFIVQLEQIQNQSVVLKNVNHWPARPLPVLKDLEKFGVPVPNR